VQSATLTVPGIHCEHCQTAIEGALSEISGVRSAQVSLADRTVAVDYDESQVSLEALKDAIIHQGYDIPA
jgi:copper chaperone